MEEKNKTDFERLLQAAQIPFKKFIENSTKNKDLFFIEYTKAEKVPDYFLYLRQYYTEDEINKHITGNSNSAAHEIGTNGSARVFELPELDKRWNEIDRELRGKHIKGELPDEFYRPDIMQTNTVKCLQEVKKELNLLENYTLWNNLNIHKEAEIRGESVLLALKKINNTDLALEILESVINDDGNKILTASAALGKRIPSTIWDTWRALKSNFNLVLKKGKVQFSNIESDKVISDLQNLIIPESNSSSKESKSHDINDFPDHEDPITSLPHFSDGCKTDLFNILKDYFNESDHDKLLSLITNNIEPQEKLLFKNSGNKLTYALKELIEAQFITGVNKKGLEEWVIKNFQYMKNMKTLTDYKKDSVHIIISGNLSPAKNPILKIESGRVVKVTDFTKKG